jgi:hypothetical protein
MTVYVWHLGSFEHVLLREIQPYLKDFFLEFGDRAQCPIEVIFPRKQRRGHELASCSSRAEDHRLYTDRYRSDAKCLIDVAWTGS